MVNDSPPICLSVEAYVVVRHRKREAFFCTFFFSSVFCAFKISFFYQVKWLSGQVPQPQSSSSSNSSQPDPINPAPVSSSQFSEHRASEPYFDFILGGLRCCCTVPELYQLRCTSLSWRGGKKDLIVDALRKNIKFPCSALFLFLISCCVASRCLGLGCF